MVLLVRKNQRGILHMKEVIIYRGTEIEFKEKSQGFITGYLKVKGVHAGFHVNDHIKVAGKEFGEVVREFVEDGHLKRELKMIDNVLKEEGF